MCNNLFSIKFRSIISIKKKCLRQNLSFEKNGFLLILDMSWTVFHFINLFTVDRRRNGRRIKTTITLSSLIFIHIYISKGRLAAISYPASRLLHTSQTINIQQCLYADIDTLQRCAGPCQTVPQRKVSFQHILFFFSPQTHIILNQGILGKQI